MNLQFSKCFSCSVYSRCVIVSAAIPIVRQLLLLTFLATVSLSLSVSVGPTIVSSRSIMARFIAHTSLHFATRYSGGQSVNQFCQWIVVSYLCQGLYFVERCKKISQDGVDTIIMCQLSLSTKRYRPILALPRCFPT